jgi:UDP-glucose 4-epimerase
MPSSAADWYRGRRVLITGGAGFIGSNLAHALVAAGARVAVADAFLPDYGANTFNLRGIESDITLHRTDLRAIDPADAAAARALMGDADVIFNLAGQVSHIDSMREPETDLDLNCRCHLRLLETCRRHNPGVKVVYAGTRQIYGRPDRLPVDETHPVRPTDVNGINKAAGEQYHLVYNNAFGLRACSLRLTNVYGPRQLIRHNRQGFIGWFVRLALEHREIQVFGDGSQLRDFVHVDDVVDAFLRAGSNDALNGGAYNVGGAAPVSHRDLVAMLVDAAGGGSVRYVEWPEDKRRIDIGSFFTDSSRFAGATGWSNTVPLAEGLARTLAFYRAHFQEYVPTV